MTSFVFQETEIALYKAKSQFEISLPLSVINELEESYYSEGVKDIGKKIKALIHKFTSAISVYAKNAIKIIELYNAKRHVNQNLKVIKRVMKKNPEIGKRKITYRSFSNFKDGIDFDVKVCRNIAYRVENLDEDWITNLMDNYYKNIDATSKYLRKITINEAAENCEAVIEDINKEISSIVKGSKNISTELDKSNNLNNKHLGLFKKMIKSIQKYIQTKVHMIVLNIEFLFANIHNSLKGYVDDQSKQVVIKRTPRLSTLEKHAKKVDTVEILGNKIELYETDRYIESEFTTGYDKPKVYFDKSFKNMPRPNQLAILYHEYGHIVNGHLGTNKYRNEYKLDKVMRKRIRRYLKYMNTEKNKLQSDDLLIYLLIELEADEFSSKYVGKSVIRKTLEHDYREVIKKIPNLSEDEQDTILATGYIRTHML